MSKVFRWVRYPVLFLTLAACGRSTGCSGCEGDNPFPDKDRVQSAIQLRISESGLAFLEQNLESILAQVLPDGLNICLPGQADAIRDPVLGIPLVQYAFCQAECSDGNVGCDVEIGIGQVDLQAVAPATVRATITFSDLNAEIDIAADPLVDCSITLDGAGFPVTADLVFSTPEPTRDLTFELQDPQFMLSDLTIHLRSDGGGLLSPLCDLLDGVINFPFLGDFLLDAIGGFIQGPMADLLNGFVEDFTCRTCEADADCPVAGGARCEAGRCMLEGACLPAPLGVEGTMDIGQLLGGAAGNLSAPIDYLATPGSYVEVEQAGLSMGMIAGAVATVNRCVPARPQPPLVEPARAPILRGNVDPDGDPFEIGVGISQEIIGHAMWAFFTSGGLCLTIGSDTVDLLNSQTLGLLLPGLRQLTRGSVPVAITLQPQEVPTATIGQNVVVPDPENEGQYMLQDPMITLEIPDLWLDFHVFIEGRWTRIFSLGLDISLPIGVAFTPDNGLIPVLGDLQAGLQNVRTANGEIMPDDAERVEGLLPVLIGPLTPILADALSNPIVLPDIMGFRLDLQDGAVRGIEQNTMLALFANLDRAPADPGVGEGARFSVETEAEVLEVHVPPTEAFEIVGRETWRGPFVRLALDAWDGSDDAAAMEFSWRLDEGTWSLFTPAREMLIRSPMLMLQGRHEIEVRARRQDSYKSLDPSPARVEVLIDSLAPDLTLALDEEAGRLRVSAEDWVSPPEAIALAVRYDAGDWVALLDPDIDTAGDFASIEVRATDEAGNVATAQLQVREAPLIGRPPAGERGVAGGCGGGSCSVGGQANGLPWLGLLLLGCLAIRRSRWARSGLLAALIGLGSGCSDSASGRDGDDGDGGPRGGVPVNDMGNDTVHECASDQDCQAANLRCQEGDDGVRRCGAVTCSDDPDVCAQVACPDERLAKCNNMGLCECETFCDGGCPDGEYCCLARDACEAAPAACAGVTCEVGFQLAVTEDGQVNPMTCELENVDCGCVELDPLDPGRVGRFSDLALTGGAAWISAYSEDWGDLVVGRWAPNQALRWTWVDGIGEGEVVAGPSGPRGGVDAEGDDVGQHTAIAASADGRLHVVYRDVTNDALRYALGVPAGDGPDGLPTYTWSSIELDRGGVGRWPSISLDPRGLPGVAYRVDRLRDGDRWVSEVRYLLAKNAEPAATADWNRPFQVAQSELIEPCGGFCPEGQLCVADTNDCAEPGADCEPCAQGTTCVGGACEVVQTVPEPPGDYPEGTGLFTTQARDVGGMPVVAWYDRTFGQLWLARFVDAGFAEPELMAGWGHPERDGDMGSNADLMIDGEGNAHLCYQDGATDSLRYLAPELGIDDWVDDGIRIQEDGREYAVHVVGEDCNVGVDPDGNPYIVYQDATAHEVLISRRDAAGEWTRSALRGHELEFQGSFGFYTRARRTESALWISSYAYNFRHDPVREGLDLFVWDL